MYSPPAVPDFSTANKIITRKQPQVKITELLLSQRPAVPASLAPGSSPYASLTAFAANLIHAGGLPPADLNVSSHRYVYPLS